MLSNNTYVKSGIFFERTTTQGRGSLHLAVNNEVNGNNVDVILRVKATRDAYLQFAPANTVKWGLIADYPDLGDFTTYNYSNNFNAIICKDNKNITTNLGGGNFSIATTTSSGKLTVDTLQRLRLLVN